MKKSNIFYLFAISIIFILVCVSQSCKRSSGDRNESVTVDPAFREFVEGFTSGPISTESGIIVRLNFDYADSSMINQTADPSLFDISPSVSGTAVWIDSRTIRFQPEEKLEPNTQYKVSFNLAKLVDVPDSLKTLVFTFNTIEQDFDMIIEQSRAYSADDLAWERLTGCVMTADAADLDIVQKMVTANQGNKSLFLKWSQDSEKKRHFFTIDSIQRGKEKSTVQISCKGTPLGLDKSLSANHTVYSINDFKVTSVKSVQYPEQTIIVRFTDPLRDDQELEGKITMGKFFNYSYVINFNELYIYPASELNKEEQLTISSTIENISGKQMGKAYSQLIIQQDLMPDVRFVSSGVILPSTNGLIIPFEAVNLKAVDVKITRIFQNNIPQFLQVNDLSGKYQLSRVGAVVLKKTIPLGNVANYNKWNLYHLDIAELIKTEPGAIYSVELSIRKEYSAIVCDEDDADSDEIFSSYNTAEDENNTDWQYYSDYDYDEYEYDYYYDWSEREDPCSRSYFSGKKASINILASDIGLMCKLGETGELIVFATNLVSAEPMANVSIEVLDYPQQVVGSGTTDSDGMCKIKPGKKPYLIIAKHDKQQSYLKITDGNSLSLSSFDVSGKQVQRGLKGFIYGERGVWRPGDSLFMTLILEDNQQIFPEGHPVIFELYNPMGNMIEKRSITESVNGFYAFHTATSPDAPTGLYKLIARVGKNVFYHRLRIETIKPNRLKIMVDPGDKIISTSNPKDFRIEAQWLHGAIAKNLKVESEIQLSRSYTAFAKFPKFIFDDPGTAFNTERFSFFSGKLDENGVVVFKPQLDLERAPGFLNAHIETRVYEPGGEFSIDFMSVKISPYASYVGLLPPNANDNTPYLFTDRTYTYKIVNLYENGKATEAKQVNISVYKMEWRYWWSSYDYSASDFMYSSNAVPVFTGQVALRSGIGTWSFKVPNDDWGKYFIRITDIESGHSAGLIQYFDWYGYNRFAEDDKTSAAMLTLATDKPNYTVGEEIRLSFSAPPGSRAYISVENGSSVIETYQKIERDGKIDFSIKATEDMAPNIYLSVSLIQPHEKTVNGLPMRLYGVVPVLVENPATVLKPVIGAPEIMRPGQTANISISESNGKPMTYTLAIVDEGLLNLTKFMTPDPHSEFYSREALGIRTWDIYDQVIGAWGGKIQRILSIGGGGDVEVDPTGQRSNRFKPMVRFVGPVTLKSGGSNTHTISIPEYVGSVRIMVVAGQNKAYGNTEKAVPVRNPLMLLGTAPRVIGPGETFRLPVAVFAMENHVKNVTINIQTNKMFTVDGSKSKQIEFTKTGDQLIAFDIVAADAIGAGQILITAQSGNEKAVWKVEMDVRPANPVMTNVISATVKEGETWETTYESIGIEGTNGNILEVSTFIPMNIDKWLTYLSNYPHGCAEQTISGAFAMLYIDKLTESSENAMKQAEAKIKYAINRVQNLQLSSGGIAMWPGSQYADEWTTSYAGHFMTEARNKGYVVSKQFFTKWKSWQQKKAKNWRHDRSYYNNDLMQAYRLYTLALAGYPEAGSMNRLAETTYLSPQSKWLLASAYAISGRTDAAKKLIAKTTTDIRPYYEYSYTYGSHIRDKAFILEAYLRMGMTNNAQDIFREIAGELQQNNWLSTQTAAQSLRAVALYLTYFPMSKQMNFNLSANNISKDFSTKNMSHTMDLGTAKTGKIKIQNTGKGTLYISVIQKGIPKESDLPASQKNLTMNVSYRGLDGKTLNPETVAQGTVFYTTVSITHPGNLNTYNSMALTQIFPSGWEVMNDRYAYEDSFSGDYTYQDIRDDRVITYFNLAKSKTISVTVRVTASFVGRFYMPMIYCEAMYDNRVSASVPGKWVRVVDQENTVTNAETD
jgi:alpha-2-macroglobulin